MTPRELVVELSCLSVQLRKEGRWFESERVLIAVREIAKVANSENRKAAA